MEREAAEWLAACDAGSLSAQQEAALQAWLALSDRHYAAFLRLQACWVEADRFGQLRVPNEPLNVDLLRSHAKPPPHRVSRSLLAIAASVLVATGLLMGIPPLWSGTEHYATGRGGYARIPLSDGSIVALNTDSEVRVHLTERRREVTLVRGEAQFIVAHDTMRPFDVYAGSKIVRAVGTAFVVRRFGGDDVQVLVTSGRVAIVAPDVQLSEVTLSALPESIPTVRAGEVARVRNGGQISVSPLGAAAQHATSWTEGRLWFDRLTLAQAVAEFNRYNRRQFVIDDPSIADIHIGGAFDADDVESFAAALKSFGIKIDETNPDIIKLSKAQL
ncbi:MAG TPA: FecR domain-containing protein [Steroidobacteraceae bacterium]|nr:FecR domain-containing protein [Steroidobacteraceae bacterium]